MTRDDIIRMAQAAGFCLDVNNGIYLCAPQHIERLIAIAAAAEREACAKLADDWPNGRDDVCLIAESIRARVEK